MNKPTIILLTGIFLSILIRTFFIINGLDVADVTKLHQMAEAILKGTNPYLLFNFASYPPIGLYMEAIILLLSNSLGIPFHMLTKILPNLADILITLVLYKFLINRGVKPIYASLWSLIFILNPISIIISSAHGQIDSITSLLVLSSIYILTFNPAKFHKLLPAVLIGLAIAIKPNPVVLLPFFLVYKKSGIKQTITFLLVSLAPAIIPLTPYLWQSPHAVIDNVFRYSGVYDISYAAILRGFWYQQNAQIWLPQAEQMLKLSKLAFIAGTAFLLLLFTQSKNLSRSCLAIYLLFTGIYFGISAQYLSWILPLAILTREKTIIPFSIAGTLSLIGFYSFFGPDILFGKFLHIKALQSKYMLPYFVGNLLLWITIIWWFITIIRNYISVSFRAFTPLHRKIALISFIVFIISLLPILKLVFDTIIQLTTL